MNKANRQWLLRRRPTGAVSPDDFEFRESVVPQAGPGDVLVRSLYFGFDPSQRMWLTDNGGYMEPVGIGQPMRTMGIGQVVESRVEGYAPGDLVEGFLSWQDYVLARADGPMPLRKLPKDAGIPLSWHLGVFGVTGLAAYFGMTDVGQVRAGDVVVVSAASGATGSVAGQIAKAMGAKKVIGIAGGADNCQWLLEQGHYDAAIDYKREDIDARLKALAPEGVNLYFDNVGGETLDTLLMNMAWFGRIVVCGAVSSGYTSTEVAGPRNYMQLCTRSLRMQGFLLFAYADRLAEGAQALGRLVQEGKLQVVEDLEVGFEKAPLLLPTLFSGKKPGKLVLKIADPE